MFENNTDVFEKWLEQQAQGVLDKINGNIPLSQDDKIVMVLKAQTNHFYHLDIDLRNEIKEMRVDSNKKFDQVDKKFEQLDKKFEQIDKKFEQIDKKFELISEELRNIYKAINAQTWKMIGAVGLIVILGKIIETFGN